MKSTLKTNVSLAALTGALALGGAASAGDLSGRVSSLELASSLEGAVVRVQELGRETSTDREGRYRFTDLPAGDYTVVVSYLGAGSETGSASVPAVGEASLDFTVGSVEQIVVTGQRGQLFDALNQRRAATNLIDVISSDAIGQFPDQNVSEAARRVAGVSVENDQGEGRFIVIRGLDPNLNASNINGVRIPAPENDIRAVALDVIDSEVLEGIIVTRSLTPDQDGDAIGGTIDIRTTSAFDRDGFFLSANAAGSYNEASDRIGPRVGVRASNVFMDGRLGLAGALSYRERTFATENVEAENWNIENGELWPDDLELRDYLVTRTRLNASFNADFRPNANHDLYFRTLFSEFEDQEYRRRAVFDFSDADIVSAADGVVTFSGGPNPDPDEDPFVIGVERDSKDRLETQTIWSIQTGGESRFGPWTANYLAAYSHAEEDEPNSIDTVDFVADFEDLERLGLNTSNATRPLLVRDVASVIGLDDPENFELDEWTFIDGITEDEEFTLRGDLRRDFFFDGYETFVQGGFSYRDREKFYTVDEFVFAGDGRSLTGFQDADIDYPLDVYGPFVSASLVRQFFNANRPAIEAEIEGEDTIVASTASDYEADETITAGYIMGGFDSDRWSVIAGVRIEDTDFTARTDQVFIGGDENTFTVGDLTFDTEVSLLPVTLEEDYTDVLPSVNVRYELADDLFLRGAYYRAIARPTFEQIVPRAEFEDDEGEGGNPDLERQQADNFDLGVEWYLGEGGILSAGLFYKDIEDFIAPVALEDVDFQGIAFSELETFINLDDSDLFGLELNYQQALTMLPAPWDDIIVGANVTFLDGTSTLADGREIDLPKLSDMLANLVLGYQNEFLDLRLSYAYRSEYLDEIGGDEETDRYVDENGQLDFTARWDVNDNWRLFTEISNITDEPFLAYANVGGRRALLQYEEYGTTYTFGLRYNY